ncbi:hypothetical protein Thermus77412_24440 [Thermus antranikianii]
MFQASRDHSGKHPRGHDDQEVPVRWGIRLPTFQARRVDPWIQRRLPSEVQHGEAPPGKLQRA